MTEETTMLWCKYSVYWSVSINVRRSWDTPNRT